MAGHGEKRSRKQEAAIAALLAEPTLEAAARTAGVSLNTLKGWLKQPGFQESYREERRKVVEHAVGRLQGACTKAIGALERNLESGSAAAEVAAARALLTFAFQGLQTPGVVKVPPLPVQTIEIRRPVSDFTDEELEACLAERGTQQASERDTEPHPASAAAPEPSAAPTAPEPAAPGPPRPTHGPAAIGPLDDEPPPGTPPPPPANRWERWSR